MSPSEADVDHMFPLFPLVGTQSFDNENQPLLAVKQPQQPTPMRPNFNSINEITSSSYSSIPSAMENASSSQYQLRPKRPESVLSIASNSSTRSFDFSETPTTIIIHHFLTEVCQHRQLLLPIHLQMVLMKVI